MDLLHIEFARAHPTFYEHPSRRPAAVTGRLHPAEELDWATWQHSQDGSWSFWHPVGVDLPEQGWKIHVSATPHNAEEVLRQVSRYCHEHRLEFKHLPDSSTVVRRNAKDTDRGGAGKFITIYTRDEQELRAALDDLDAVLHDLDGPYVLSDLRWRSGPLSVRYGAFAPLRARLDDGRDVYALRAPDGSLVEDLREPTFTPPEWVTLPPFLREQFDALGDGVAPEGFSYRIDTPLGYSTAGGIYAATDASGAAVVLKEARPHTGYTPDGRDAITRLRDEEARLRAVAGPGVVPVRGAAELFGHRFLVLDRIEGTSLNRAMVLRSPLIRAGSTPADYLEYRQWALAIGEQLDAVIARIHAAGYTHGDLHPGNVIVGPDDRITLIDFELSLPVDDPTPAITGAPGFVAPDGRSGVDADFYALSCIKLSLFLPLTTLLPLHEAKAEQVLLEARDLFALDDSWVERVREPLLSRTVALTHRPSALSLRAASVAARWEVGAEEGILELQVLLARSLASAADFSRADRAWPGDPRQFVENGYGLAHGASGILHALDSTGLEPHPLGVQWLEDAVRDALRGNEPGQLGLYDGLAGASLVLRRWGRDAVADEIRDRIRSADHDALGTDLYGGLAGIGLWLLTEASRDEAGVSQALLDQARAIASTLRTRIDAAPTAETEHPTVATDRGGLMRGWTGTSLFALRLYERTGEHEHLRLATNALDYDLARCITADDGSLQVNEGWRVVPGLGAGSAGIGLVIAQLLPHLAEPEPYRDALSQITRASCVSFVIEPGVFYGRAGLILYLSALARLGLATAESDDALAHHVRALRLHAIPHGIGIGIPGRKLLRLSCDLATGSAGVIAALQSYDMLTNDENRPGWDQLIPLLLPAPAGRVPKPPTSETPRR